MPRFPVRFLDASGQPAAAVEDGKPYLRLQLAPAPGMSGSPVDVEAIVDTGAQLNALTPALISAMGYPWKLPGTTTTGSGLISTPLHTGRVRLGTFDITTDFSAVDLRAAGNTFDVIVGCLFLKLGTLHMDFRRADFWFEIADPGALTFQSRSFR